MWKRLGRQNETKSVEEVRTQNETKGAEQEDQSGPAQDPELTATNATIDSSTPPPPVTRDDTWCISAVITGSAGNAVAEAEAEGGARIAQCSRSSWYHKGKGALAATAPHHTASPSRSY